MSEFWARVCAYILWISGFGAFAWLFQPKTSVWWAIPVALWLLLNGVMAIKFFFPEKEASDD